MHIQFHTQFKFQLVQQCIQIPTGINSSMYIRTSFVCSTLRSAMVCWPIIQQNPLCFCVDFERELDELYNQSWMVRRLHCISCQFNSSVPCTTSGKFPTCLLCIFVEITALKSQLHQFFFTLGAVAMLTRKKMISFKQLNGDSLFHFHVCF